MRFVIGVFTIASESDLQLLRIRRLDCSIVSAKIRYDVISSIYYEFRLFKIEELDFDLLFQSRHYIHYTDYSKESLRLPLFMSAFGLQLN